MFNIIRANWLLLAMLAILTSSAYAAVIDGSSTPYNPQNNMKYYFEANFQETWPTCNYRFISYTNDCSIIDLWQEAGVNQEITLRATGSSSTDTWKLETKCNAHIDYSTTTCSDINIGTASTADRSNVWKLVPTTGNFNEWQFEAVNRPTECQDSRYLTFNTDCNDVHTLVLGNLGNHEFFIHPVDSSSMSIVHHIATSDNRLCADPFVWFDPDDATNKYKMACTGLPLFATDELSRDATFDYVGTMLGNPTQEWESIWADNLNRWAPENLSLGNSMNLAIFSSPQSPNNEHRLGVVLSKEGALSGKWDEYSASTFMFGQSGEKTCDSSGAICQTNTDCSLVCKSSGNECSSHSDCGGGKKCTEIQTCAASGTGTGIPNSEGGDIDAHFFTDTDGKTYILWKTDDNAINLPSTRLWINEVTISPDGPNFVDLVGDPVEILDSTGLWWVTSWIGGGSLIEGPQIIKKGAYYYLFFAAGRYCQADYSEGVARSTSLMGPYEKLGTPLLSTGIVGEGSTGIKLIGPGHASFVQDQDETTWIIFHASEGQNCDRRPYVERLLWTDDNWPVVVFNESSGIKSPTPTKGPSLSPVTSSPTTSNPAVSPSTSGPSKSPSLRPVTSSPLTSDPTVSPSNSPETSSPSKSPNAPQACLFKGADCKVGEEGKCCTKSCVVKGRKYKCT